MSYERLPIVGGYYRPPALCIISALAIGTELFLCAEPDNPADPNAVAVWISSDKIPASAHPYLEENLPKYDFTLDQILSEEQWHLGYIPRNFASMMRDPSNKIVPDDDVLIVEFATSADGKPRVKFQEPIL